MWIMWITCKKAMWIMWITRKKHYLQPVNVDNVDNFFPHYPHAKTLDFKGFFKNQKKLSTFFLKLSTKKGRVIHIFFEILCKPKNVDNFVDNFFKEWKN